MNEIILLKTIEFLLKVRIILRRPHPTAYETICCRQPMDLPDQEVRNYYGMEFVSSIHYKSVVHCSLLRDYETSATVK
ncbi:hypothetical protein NPIL_181841 [Nephila pilipes]|uniref:Uncharacterized protein n=1 Tax=Nephila pilipes TaxID=299642 RepID=A0A8X6PI32_NEPPI|nr:hypothetical protein NPIL_181841 [Nephila pilipes]